MISRTRGDVFAPGLLCGADLRQPQKEPVVAERGNLGPAKIQGGCSVLDSLGEVMEGVAGKLLRLQED